MKPRLKLLSRANWQCSDDFMSRRGKSAKQAYDRWLIASLLQAASEANLCVPMLPKSKKAGRPPKADKPVAIAASPEMVATLDLPPAHKKPLVPPGKNGFVVPKPEASKEVEPAQVEVKYKAPGIVRLTDTRREYKPGTSLKLNAERAKQSQKPLVTPRGTGNGHEISKLGRR